MKAKAAVQNARDILDIAERWAEKVDSWIEEENMTVLFHGDFTLSYHGEDGIGFFNRFRMRAGAALVFFKQYTVPDKGDRTVFIFELQEHLSDDEVVIHKRPRVYFWMPTKTAKRVTKHGLL